MAVFVAGRQHDAMGPGPLQTCWERRVSDRHKAEKDSLARCGAEAIHQEQQAREAQRRVASFARRAAQAQHDAERKVSDLLEKGDAHANKVLAQAEAAKEKAVADRLAAAAAQEEARLSQQAEAAAAIREDIITGVAQLQVEDVERELDETRQQAAAREVELLQRVERADQAARDAEERLRQHFAKRMATYEAAVKEERESAEQRIQQLEGLLAQSSDRASLRVNDARQAGERRLKEAEEKWAADLEQVRADLRRTQALRALAEEDRSAAEAEAHTWRAKFDVLQAETRAEHARRIQQAGLLAESEGRNLCLECGQPVPEPWVKRI